MIPSISAVSSMNSEQFNEEIRFRLLKIFDSSEKELTQRKLAEQLGISLGKTNYCITALAKEGLIKIRRFKNASSKLAYAYMLTPKGLEKKFHLLVHFLSRKLREHENLKKEIAELNEEITNSRGIQLTTMAGDSEIT